METKKILIYGKDGEVKIVVNGKVQSGEAYFEESKNSTIANSLYNLARVLYSCATDEETAYEVAVISSVYYKVMSSQLKKETWTGLESYYVGQGQNRVENHRELTEDELEVRQHVVNAMQASFLNTNVLNMRDIAEEKDWKAMIDLVKPKNNLVSNKGIKKITTINLAE